MRKFFVVALLLMIGLTLLVSPTQAQDEATCASELVVQADDWLSKIADKEYGDLLAFPAIVDATNVQAASDDSFTRINNPDIIEPGWKLCIPSVADAETLLDRPPAPTVAKVRVALNAYENNLTPFTHSLRALPNTHDLIMLIYDSLFWSANRAVPEPWLAESAEPSDDFTVWTVNLRDGVTWHDGEPFTAEDVKFSFEYYKASLAPGRYAHHVYDQPRFASAEVIDPLTVQLTFEEPVPGFRVLPGGDLPIIPKHIWESIEAPLKASDITPIGTGPYMLVENVPDELYRFAANESYFKGRPTVDEIEMPIIPNPQAAFGALQGGQIDSVINPVPPPLVGPLSQNEEIEVVNGTRMVSMGIFWNTRKAPLTDVNLRKAMSLAVDSQALVDTVLLGNGRPGNDSFIHPDSVWALPEAGHEYDPTRAAALLDENGYNQTDADGVRLSPDGTRLEFTMLVPSNNPLLQRTTQLVAEQLAPLGIKLNVDPQDPATIRQIRVSQAKGIPEYDAHVGPLESHTHADPDGLYYFFHSPGPQQGVGGIFTGYKNPEFDALVEQASLTSDREERRAILYQAQEILAAEVPALVYFYPDGNFAYRVEAYDGWLSDPGHGIFTKRSFLPGYATGR